LPRLCRTRRDLRGPGHAGASGRSQASAEGDSPIVGQPGTRPLQTRGAQAGCCTWGSRPPEAPRYRRHDERLGPPEIRAEPLHQVIRVVECQTVDPVQAAPRLGPGPDLGQVGTGRVHLARARRLQAGGRDIQPGEAVDVLERQQHLVFAATIAHARQVGCRHRGPSCRSRRSGDRAAHRLRRRRWPAAGRWWSARSAR
jgi:hypothetical protein